MNFVHKPRVASETPTRLGLSPSRVSRYADSDSDWRIYKFKPGVVQVVVVVVIVVIATFNWGRRTVDAALLSGALLRISNSPVGLRLIAQIIIMLMGFSEYVYIHYRATLNTCLSNVNTAPSSSSTSDPEIVIRNCIPTSGTTSVRIARQLFPEGKWGSLV